MNITNEMIEAARSAYNANTPTIIPRGGKLAHETKLMHTILSAALSAQPVAVDVDALAQEIRRVDGNHSLGAGALAEALMPFLSALTTPPAPAASEPVAWLHQTANWSDVDRDKVMVHCWDDGPYPVPLYLAPPAPTGDGWPVPEVFDALRDAYIRGATWYRQNEDFGGLLHKAACDYADNATSPAAAPTPPKEGE